MMINFDLPDLIEFSSYPNYEDYEEELLRVYRRDLWNSGLTFGSSRVMPRVHKKFNLGSKSLDWTFAHITTKGPNEAERELDLRRCERIGWIKPIIENAHEDCVKVYENERRNRNGKYIRSVVLWCESANSKIVLTPRETSNHPLHFLVTTFYLINNPNAIRKHNKEFNEYINLNGEYQII